MALTLRCEMLGHYERPFQEPPMWLNLVHEGRLERTDDMDLEQSVSLSGFLYTHILQPPVTLSLYPNEDPVVDLQSSLTQSIFQQ